MRMKKICCVYTQKLIMRIIINYVVIIKYLHKGLLLNLWHRNSQNNGRIRIENRSFEILFTTMLCRSKDESFDA